MQVKTIVKMWDEKVRVGNASKVTLDLLAEFADELTEEECKTLRDASDILREKLWSPRFHKLEDLAERKLR